jgi:hypothetical protein
MRYIDWKRFSAVLRFLLVELRNGLKWPLVAARIHFFLLRFAFVTLSLFDLPLLYATLVQFSLHSGRDGNALA